MDNNSQLFRKKSSFDFDDIFISSDVENSISLDEMLPKEDFSTGNVSLIDEEAISTAMGSINKHLSNKHISNDRITTGKLIANDLLGTFKDKDFATKAVFLDVVSQLPKEQVFTVIEAWRNKEVEKMFGDYRSGGEACVNPDAAVKMSRKVEECKLLYNAEIERF